MVSVGEAQRIVLDSVERLGWEYAELLDALDGVLAEDVIAPAPLPPWDNSAMDGYALRAEDSRGATDAHPVALEVVGAVAAGQVFEGILKKNQAVRIMTGGPLPRGADAVIRQEDTQPSAQGILIRRQVRLGQDVRYQGEDVKAGAQVLHAGTPCRPGAIGLLAAIGRKRVAIYRRPRVSILATGDEILPWDETPTPGKIHNSNSYALAAQVLEGGGVPVLLGSVADNKDLLATRLQEGVQADLLVTTGGVSVGDHDLVADTLGVVGANVRVQKVNMRPGKPFTFSVLDRKPIFSLPGNPISSMVTFELFVRPAMKKMQGHRHVFHAEIVATATQSIRNKDRRPAYLRVILTETGTGYDARLTGDQGSAMLHSIASADGLAVVPGETEIPVGDRLRVLLLGDRLAPSGPEPC